MNPQHELARCLSQFAAPFLANPDVRAVAIPGGCLLSEASQRAGTGETDRKLADATLTATASFRSGAEVRFGHCRGVAMTDGEGTICLVVVTGSPICKSLQRTLRRGLTMLAKARQQSKEPTV